MKNVLERLNWEPMWVAHLGCMKGCADYLGLKIPKAWLFGGTGHAFVINIHESLCPSGPTNWNTEMLFKLSRNLGIRISRVTGYKEDPDFEEKRWEAFDLVKEYIDSGLPCYSWELEIPEYYVIKGYTDAEYIYAGVDEGRRNWRTLGISEIGVLEVCGVSLGMPASDAKVVADAIKFALEIAKIQVGPRSIQHLDKSPAVRKIQRVRSRLQRGRLARMPQIRRRIPQNSKK